MLFHACIVDEYVQPAERIDGLFNHPLSVGHITDVTLKLRPPGGQA
jgi:hypothetical protein